MNRILELLEEEEVPIKELKLAMGKVKALLIVTLVIKINIISNNHSKFKTHQ